MGVLPLSPLCPTLSACSHFCRASSNSSMPEHKRGRREESGPQQKESSWASPQWHSKGGSEQRGGRRALKEQDGQEHVGGVLITFSRMVDLQRFT